MNRTPFRRNHVLLALLLCLLGTVNVQAKSDSGSRDSDSPVTESAKWAFERGYRQLENQQFEKAIESYNLVLRIDPENGPAYYNRGLAAMLCRRYTAAIRDFDAALERNPRDADALFCRGITRKAAGDFAAAAQDMEAAAEIDPEYRESAAYGRGTWAIRWILYGVAAVCLMLCALVGLHFLRMLRQFHGA